MMADSTKNNTVHGGEGRRHNEYPTDLPENIETQLTRTPVDPEEIKQQDDHSECRLQSPTIQESGYNTEASPATSSSHGTPGQHFDFNNLLGDEESVHRQRPNLTIHIPSFNRDDDHPSNLYGQRQPTNNSATETPSADILLNIGESKGMSQSFQDIRLFGVTDSDDEEEETEKEDEWTSSEDKYLRESQQLQPRRCSLRRRHFGGEDDSITDEDCDSLTTLPVGLGVVNFFHQVSHESQDSDLNSPTASTNPLLEEHVSNALQQFLEQDITSSSIGIAENPSGTSDVTRGDWSYQNDSRHSHDMEPQVFHLSISSDEGNHPEVNNTTIKDNLELEDHHNDEEDDDNDDVFTIGEEEVQGMAYDNNQTLANHHGRSTSCAIPAPHPSLASLRHSACSTPNMFLDKPPISPSSLSSSLGRRRRNACLSSSVSVRLQLSGGACLSHVGMSRSFSVGTQTPHMASLLIQDVLSMPTALPNEARGNVVSRLRRLSENGSPLPASPEPLPDIIPFVRDRSSSLPEIQAFDRRRVIRTGRLIGQELRRMSDEFNSSRRNSYSSNAELQHHASSFPGVRPLLSLMRDALQTRSRSSSVDLDDDTNSQEDE